jgi:uncharacterized glyoxalase superfamily protein PhnB
MNFAPEGWHTLTPRIVVAGALEFVAFLRNVFGATAEYQSAAPTVVGIGDSLIIVSEAETRKPMPAFLYVYVEDADATYRQALQAGARSLEEPFDTPYGDRRGMIEDRWGNTWQIATTGSG